jgi:hypothetical protein
MVVDVGFLGLVRALLCGLPCEVAECREALKERPGHGSRGARQCVSCWVVWSVELGVVG